MTIAYDPNHRQQQQQYQLHPVPQRVKTPVISSQQRYTTTERTKSPISNNHELNSAADIATFDPQSLSSSSFLYNNTHLHRDTKPSAHIRSPIPQHAQMQQNFGQSSTPLFPQYAQDEHSHLNDKVGQQIQHNINNNGAQQQQSTAGSHRSNEISQRPHPYTLAASATPELGLHPGHTRRNFATSTGALFDPSSSPNGVSISHQRIFAPASASNGSNFLLIEPKPYTLDAIKMHSGELARIAASAFSWNDLKFAMLCLAWYASSALTNNFGKALLSNYNYPVTLTHVQFLFTSAFIYSMNRTGLGVKLLRPTAAIIVEMAPLALFLIASHVLSSIAISRIPVSFVHTIKALSPLFTVGVYRIFLQTHYPTKIYISLIPLTLGVMLACASKVSFELIGCAAALASTLVFVVQNVYNKHMMRHTRVDRLNLLFYSSILAYSLMVPLWFLSDGVLQLGLKAPSTTSSKLPSLTLTTLTLFVANGTMHFAQQLIAFSVLCRTSPVTYSIASLLKRVVVILASILWFGDGVGIMQALGIGLAMYGVWIYQQAKVANNRLISVEEEEGEEKAERGLISIWRHSTHSDMFGDGKRRRGTSVVALRNAEEGNS